MPGQPQHPKPLAFSQLPKGRTLGSGLLLMMLGGLFVCLHACGTSAGVQEAAPREPHTGREINQERQTQDASQEQEVRDASPLPEAQGEGGSEAVVPSESGPEEPIPSEKSVVERSPEKGADTETRACRRDPGWGQPCRIGEGACEALGKQVCTPDGRSLRCDAQEDTSKKAAETCNGKDDDCNGKIDDLSGVQEHLRTGTDLEKLWDETGTQASARVALWLPKRRIHTRNLGTIATPSHNAPQASPFPTIAVAASTYFAQPTSYQKVWDSSGTGATSTIALWRPLCPTGFVALGTAVTRHLRSPEGYGIVCLSQSIAKMSKLTSMLWSDQGSGSPSKVSLWGIQGSPFFYAHSDHSKPSATVWQLDPALLPLCPFAPKPPDHGLQISFDYRFAQDFFKDPKRKKTLEDAARLWSRVLRVNFPFVPAGSKFQITDWDNKSHTITLQEDLDDLLIMLYTAPPGASYKAQANYKFVHPGVPFRPWLGWISINATDQGRPWFFDQTPDTTDDIPSQTHYDFLTTAMHEIGHILGFLSHAYKRQGLLKDGKFTGARANARNQNRPIPLAAGSSHLASDFTDGLQSPGVERYLMHGFDIVQGFRTYPYALEAAMLEDMGFSVRYSVFPMHPDRKAPTDPRKQAYLQRHPNALTDPKYPIGLWMFDDPKYTKQAILGRPLRYAPAALPNDPTQVRPLQHITGGVRVHKGAYFLVDHGLKASSGGKYANAYSLLFDIRIPKHGLWYSLYDSEFDSGGNGADAFIHTNGTVGQGTYSKTTFPTGSWNRLILTVDNTSNTIKAYLNGKAILTKAADKVDGRFALYTSPPLLLLFADKDGYDEEIDVKRVALFHYPLTATQAQHLATPTTEIAP